LWEWTSCYKPSNCGKSLKQFQPSKRGNTVCGTGNDSWYGKIEIDARKEMGNPQPSTIYRLNLKSNIGLEAKGRYRVCSSSTKCWLVLIIYLYYSCLKYSQTLLERVQDNKYLSKTLFIFRKLGSNGDQKRNHVLLLREKYPNSAYLVGFIIQMAKGVDLLPTHRKRFILWII